MAEVVTSDEALAYLGIDNADEMILSNINRTIKTADKFLEGSIGKNYPRDDSRAKEIALIIIDDLYSNRGYMNTSAMTNNVRRLVDDLSMQLRMELLQNASV